MYYDYNRILTYNAFLNFLIGERGVGKTYGASKFVTSRFINKQEEFVYIRRYKSELQKAVPEFFKSLIINNEFPDHNLSVKGNKFLIDNTVAGYSFSLSTAQSLKSTNFPKVKTIIFDEFIIEEGQNHYIKNEVENFLGMVESIARMKDVRIFMLANAVTITNPYFIYFDISLPYNTDIKTYKDGLILVQYMYNKEYRTAKAKTKFGMLTSGTEYSKYANENNFRLDNKNFIEKKSGTSKCSFGIKYKEHTFGVWFDYNIGKIFVSEDINCVQIFACTLNDHTPNTMLLSAIKDYTVWKTFIKNYKLGNVYYENIKIKNIVQELIKFSFSKKAPRKISSPKVLQGTDISRSLISLQ